MTRYIEPSTGAEFEASSASDLVHQLHATSQTPAVSDAAWMNESAARLKEATGCDFRHDTPDAFIADLEVMGYLKQKPDKKP